MRECKMIIRLSALFFFFFFSFPLLVQSNCSRTSLSPPARQVNLKYQKSRPRIGPIKVIKDNCPSGCNSIISNDIQCLSVGANTLGAPLWPLAWLVCLAGRATLDANNNNRWKGPTCCLEGGNTDTHTDRAHCWPANEQISIRSVLMSLLLSSSSFNII